MEDKYRYNSDWRKVASTIYRKPVDSKILGSVEIDVTELEKFISQKRKEGVKTTLTYIITLIVGRALREEVPELNAYIRRGKVIARERIDATVSVLLEGGQMGSVMIENIDKHTIESFSEEIAKKIAGSRKGHENDTMKNKSAISKIPWPLRSWIYYVYKTVTLNWGLSFPLLNIDANSFGSFVVSNIGTLGLDTGFGALFPAGNISFVLILGGVEKKPVVVDDNIVIRRMLSLAATLDHRVVDGSHGGKLFRAIRHYVKSPEKLEYL